MRHHAHQRDSLKYSLESMRECSRESMRASYLLSALEIYAQSGLLGSQWMGSTLWMGENA